MINGFDDDRIKALESTVQELYDQIATYRYMTDTLLARVDALECRDVASVDKIKEAFGYAINHL